MKGAVLGANWSLCDEAMDQAVVPATGLPSSSTQSKAAPPHSWTSIPRCRLYQACSAEASLALKKMPPMPVTLFMQPPKPMLSGKNCCCGPMWNRAERPRPGRIQRPSGLLLEDQEKGQAGHQHERAQFLDVGHIVAGDQH